MSSRRSALANGLAAALALTSSGCIGLPEQDVREALDEATGTSLTRLARPIELLTVEPRGTGADPFAYVAPFETNRMGKRRAFLWIAVPDERGEKAQPSLSVAGQAVVLGALRAAREAGVAEWPYRAPAPWSRVVVHELDSAALDALRARGEWRLSLSGPTGTTAFTGSPRPPNAVADFVTRLGVAGR